MATPCYLWDDGTCAPGPTGTNNPLCFDTQPECDAALHGYVATRTTVGVLQCVVALCDPLFSPDEDPTKFCYIDEAECIAAHAFYKRTSNTPANGVYPCTGPTMCDPREANCYKTQALCEGATFWTKKAGDTTCTAVMDNTCTDISDNCFQSYALCCAAKGCEQGYAPPDCRMIDCDPDEEEDCYPTYVDCYNATSPNADNGLSRGAIIGISVAVGFVALVLILGFLYFVWKSKQQKAALEKKQQQQAVVAATTKK